MENPKFQVFKSSTNNQFYFRLRAKNGETVLSSEGYVAKSSCLDGIKSVRVHAPYDSYYSKFGQLPNFYFTLSASNGEKLGRSEMYTTAVARNNGIEAVKRDAPTAPVEDLTLVATR